MVLLTMTLPATTLAAGPAQADIAVPLAKAGDTAVLKWQDGKKAVFLLAFDDNCQSHIKNAIPALKQHGYVGTFYINPGNGPFKSQQKTWEHDLPGNPAVVYGNHTFSHCGATHAAQLESELAQCNAVIDACYPGRKTPRLVSFGQPGGVPWTVSTEDGTTALAKHHLINRPNFWGAGILVKTTADMEALVDKAIAKGEMGHLDFHGVGGDWLAASMEFFNAFLNKLDACRDKLWVTDHISYHKYLTERTTAVAKVAQADATQIRLQLSSAADPALYDLPLTLETRVPATWTTCTVAQGAARQQVSATNGVVRYAATPGTEEIAIRAAK